MELVYSGVGPAFANRNQWQTQGVLKSNSGKIMLLDCGSDVRHSLDETLGLGFKDIDAVFISHLHGDHIGGLEGLAFSRYFGPDAAGNKTRPLLFSSFGIMQNLWDKSLRGGLESIENKVMVLADYFDCSVVPANATFTWEGILFRPFQTIHIVNGFCIVESYGLFITSENGRTIMWTADTQFAPSQMQGYYDIIDYEAEGLIFHDAETAPYSSGVHASYRSLLTLPEATRKKMHLIHYQPGFISSEQAKADGFGGLVEKGQSFYF